MKYTVSSTTITPIPRSARLSTATQASTTSPTSSGTSTLTPTTTDHTHTNLATLNQLDTHPSNPDGYIYLNTIDTTTGATISTKAKAGTADTATSANEATHAQSADTAHDLDNWQTADTRYISRTHDDTASGNITHLGQVNYQQDIQSTTYTPGTNSFDGTAWQLHQDPTTHQATLTTDHLRIRGTLTAYELIIRQVRALCGSLGITQACGRVKSVDLTTGRYSYHLHLEGDPTHGYGGFQPGDYIRCQRYTTSGIRGYWVQIEAISNGGECLHILRTQFTHTIHIGSGADDYDQATPTTPIITTHDGTPILADGTTYTLTTDDAIPHDTTQATLPAPGDEIVQYGSAIDTTRQSAIYIHTDTAGTPAIDLLQGINQKSFAGTLRLRIGGTLPDGSFGLYVLNGTILSQSANGFEHYALRPDGSFQLGNGAIEYNPHDGHITIANGVEINWEQVTPATTTWDKITDRPTTYPTTWSQVNATPQWLTTWQGTTTAIGAYYVAAKSAFFGSKNQDNTYTGILMSADPITLGTNTDARGLVAIHQDQARVIIDPSSQTYRFHGNILSEGGQVSGLHVGLSLNGITTITADNFAQILPTTTFGGTRYIPDYYRINPVIIIQSIPTTITSLKLQLPPTATTDEARLFSYAFLGHTLHIINQTDQSITLYGGTYQSLADYLKGTFLNKGATYTLKANTSVAITAHLDSSGTIYWVTEAATSIPTASPSDITPILPPSANKSWTTDTTPTYPTA